MTAASSDTMATVTSTSASVKPRRSVDSLVLREDDLMRLRIELSVYLEVATKLAQSRMQRYRASCLHVQDEFRLGRSHASVTPPLPNGMSTLHLQDMCNARPKGNYY